MQKIVIVTGYWNQEGIWGDSTKEVNELLEEGWKVVNANPMGAYGFGTGHGSAGEERSHLGHHQYHDKGFASLIVLERD